MTHKSSIKGILFDLDGTLIDTAPDIIASINAICKLKSKPENSIDKLRPFVTQGSNKLLELALNVTPDHSEFKNIKQNFLNHYQQNISTHSKLFDGVDNLLHNLNQNNIPWGIVTNKPGYLTQKLLQNFAIMQLSRTNIFRDTLEHCKPHPAPMILASKELGISPQDIIYIGDALTDIQAGKNAGMRTIAASYGYIEPSTDLNTWNADHIIDHPTEIESIILT